MLTIIYICICGLPTSSKILPSTSCICLCLNKRAVTYYDTDINIEWKSQIPFYQDNLLLILDIMVMNYSTLWLVSGHIVTILKQVISKLRGCHMKGTSNVLGKVLKTPSIAWPDETIYCRYKVIFTVDINSLRKYQFISIVHKINTYYF